MSSNQQLQRYQRFIPLAISALSIVIGLVVLEILARFSLPGRASARAPIQSPLTEYDPIYGWRLQRGAAEKSGVQFDQTLTYRTNASGRRGDIARESASSDNFRIVIFGETSGFGLGVEERELFFQQIYDYLRPGVIGSELELINASVPNYGLDQYALLLEYESERLKPNLGIILLPTYLIYPLAYPAHRMYDPKTITDFAKPYFILSSTSGAPELMLKNSPTPEVITAELYDRWVSERQPPTLLDRLSKGLRIAQYLKDSLRNTNTEYYFGQAEIFPPYSTNSSELAVFTQLIYRLKSQLRKVGASEMFIILPVPENFTVRSSYPVAHQTISRICREGLLNCIDLLQEFGRTGGAKLYFEGESVLNREGHQVLANEIKVRLRNLLQTVNTRRTTKAATGVSPEAQKEQLLEMLKDSP